MIQQVSKSWSIRFYDVVYYRTSGAIQCHWVWPSYLAHGAGRLGIGKVRRFA